MRRCYFFSDVAALKMPCRVGSSTSCDNHDVNVKEVVVIGNGPSAITLSYLLSGNVPSYVGFGAVDELLHKRLSQRPDEPLVLQDLEELANVSNKNSYIDHLRNLLCSTTICVAINYKHFRYT